MNPKEDKLLQEKSCFNKASLIYKTIAWTLIISFSWQQLASGADFSFLQKPAVDKQTILDKVKSLVDEGTDLSSLNQQEEKYITKQGYTAIEAIKHMRQEQERLNNLRNIEHRRKYNQVFYNVTPETQQQAYNLSYARYDSHVVYQQLLQIVTFAREMAYKAGSSYVLHPDGKKVFFQAGLVRAVLNEKIEINGEVYYSDTFNMIYDENALLKEYTKITHNGQTNFDLYNITHYDPTAKMSIFEVDRGAMVSIYGHITEEHHWVTYTADSRFYGSDETNAVKNILDHQYTVREYGNSTETWTEQDELEHEIEYLAYDEDTGLPAEWIEYIYNDEGEHVGTLEVSDIEYDLDTQEIISQYVKEYAIQDGNAVLVQEGTVYVSGACDEAYNVVSYVSRNSAGSVDYIVDAYLDSSDKVLFVTIRKNLVFASGVLISFKQSKYMVTEWDASGRPLFLNENGALIWKNGKLEGVEADYENVLFNVLETEDLGSGNERIRAKSSGYKVDGKDKTIEILEVRNSQHSLVSDNMTVSDDGYIYVSTKTYDENGKLQSYTSSKCSIEGNNIISETTAEYTYHENGKRATDTTRRINYADDAGVSSEYYTYTEYNEQGDRKHYESKSYSSSGSLRKTLIDYGYVYVRFFDADGNEKFYKKEIREFKTTSNYSGATSIEDINENNKTSEYYTGTKKLYNSKRRLLETKNITIKDSGDITEDLSTKYYSDEQGDNLVYSLTVRKTFDAATEADIQQIKTDIEQCLNSDDIIIDEGQSYSLADLTLAEGTVVGPKSQRATINGYAYEQYDSDSDGIANGENDKFRKTSLVSITASDTGNITKSVTDYKYNSENKNTVTFTLTDKYDCDDVIANVIDAISDFAYNTNRDWHAINWNDIYSFFSGKDPESSDLTFTRNDYIGDLLDTTVYVKASDSGSVTYRETKNAYDTQSRQVVTATKTSNYDYDSGYGILGAIKNRLKPNGALSENSNLDGFTWATPESVNLNCAHNKYYSDGKLSEKISVYANSDGDITQTTTGYVYDSEGRTYLNSVLTQKYSYVPAANNPNGKINSLITTAENMVTDTKEAVNAGRDPQPEIMDFNFSADSSLFSESTTCRITQNIYDGDDLDKKVSLWITEEGDFTQTIDRYTQKEINGRKRQVFYYSVKSEYKPTSSSVTAEDMVDDLADFVVNQIVNPFNLSSTIVHLDTVSKTSLGLGSQPEDISINASQSIYTGDNLTAKIDVNLSKDGEYTETVSSYTYKKFGDDRERQTLAVTLKNNYIAAAGISSKDIVDELNNGLGMESFIQSAADSMMTETYVYLNALNKPAAVFNLNGTETTLKVYQSIYDEGTYRIKQRRSIDVNEFADLKETVNNYTDQQINGVYKQLISSTTTKEFIVKNANTKSSIVAGKLYNNYIYNEGGIASTGNALVINDTLAGVLGIKLDAATYNCTQYIYEGNLIKEKIMLKTTEYGEVTQTRCSYQYEKINGSDKNKSTATRTTYYDLDDYVSSSGRGKLVQDLTNYENSITADGEITVNELILISNIGINLDAYNKRVSYKCTQYEYGFNVNGDDNVSGDEKKLIATKTDFDISETGAVKQTINKYEYQDIDGTDKSVQTTTTVNNYNLSMDLNYNNTADYEEKIVVNSKTITRLEDLINTVDNYKNNNNSLENFVGNHNSYFDTTTYNFTRYVYNDYDGINGIRGELERNYVKKISISVTDDSQVTETITEYGYQEIDNKHTKVIDWTATTTYDFIKDGLPGYTSAVIIDAIEGHKALIIASGINMDGYIDTITFSGTQSIYVDANNDGEIKGDEEKQVKRQITTKVAADGKVTDSWTDNIYQLVDDKYKKVNSVTKNKVYDFGQNLDGIAGPDWEAMTAAGELGLAKVVGAMQHQANTLATTLKTRMWNNNDLLTNYDLAETDKNKYYDGTSYKSTHNIYNAQGSVVETVDISISDEGEVKETTTENAYASYENGALTTRVTDKKTCTKVYYFGKNEAEAKIGNFETKRNSTNFAYQASSYWNDALDQIVVNVASGNIFNLKFVFGLTNEQDPIPGFELVSTTTNSSATRYNKYGSLLYSANEYKKTGADNALLEQSYSRERKAYTKDKDLAWTHKQELKTDGTVVAYVSVNTEDLNGNAVLDNANEVADNMDYNGDGDTKDAAVSENLGFAIGSVLVYVSDSGLPDERQNKKLEQTAQVTLNPDGTREIQKIYYEYYSRDDGTTLDGKQKKKTVITETLDIEGVTTATTETTIDIYNSRGKLLKTSTTNSSYGEVSYTVNTYEEDGQTMLRSKSWSLKKLEDNSYKAAEKTISFTEYNKGKVRSTATYNHHYDGSWEVSCSYNGIADNGSKVTIAYNINDEKGKVIKEQTIYRGRSGNVQLKIKETGIRGNMFFDVNQLVKMDPISELTLQSQNPADDFIGVSYYEGYVTTPLINSDYNTKQETTTYYDFRKKGFQHKDTTTNEYKGSTLLRSETLRDFTNDNMDNPTKRVALTINYSKGSRRLYSYTFQTYKNNETSVSLTLDEDAADIPVGIPDLEGIPAVVKNGYRVYDVNEDGYYVYSKGNIYSSETSIVPAPANLYTSYIKLLILDSDQTEKDILNSKDNGDNALKTAINEIISNRYLNERDLPLDGYKEVETIPPVQQFELKMVSLCKQLPLLKAIDGIIGTNFSVEAYNCDINTLRGNQLLYKIVQQIACKADGTLKTQSEINSSISAIKDIEKLYAKCESDSSTKDIVEIIGNKVVELAPGSPITKEQEITILATVIGFTSMDSATQSRLVENYYYPIYGRTILYYIRQLAPNIEFKQYMLDGLRGPNSNLQWTPPIVRWPDIVAGNTGTLWTPPVLEVSNELEWEWTPPVLSNWTPPVIAAGLVWIPPVLKLQTLYMPEVTANKIYSQINEIKPIVELSLNPPPPITPPPPTIVLAEQLGIMNREDILGWEIKQQAHDDENEYEIYYSRNLTLSQEYTDVIGYSANYYSYANDDSRGKLQTSFNYKFDDANRDASNNPKPLSFEKINNSYGIFNTKAYIANTKKWSMSYDLSGNEKELKEYSTFNEHNQNTFTETAATYSSQAYAGMDIKHLYEKYEKTYTAGLLTNCNVYFTDDSSRDFYITNAWYTNGIRNVVHNGNHSGHGYINLVALLKAIANASFQCKLKKNSYGYSGYWYQDTELELPTKGELSEEAEQAIEKQVDEVAEGEEITKEKIEETYNIQITGTFSQIALWLLDNALKVFPKSMIELLKSFNFLGTEQTPKEGVIARASIEEELGVIDFFWDVADLVKAQFKNLSTLAGIIKSAVKDWVSTIFHEVGHVVDFTKNTLLSDESKLTFDLLHKYSKKDADYASSYGKTSADEDWATTFESYASDSKAMFDSQSDIFINKALTATEPFAFTENGQDKAYIFNIDAEGNVTRDVVNIEKDENNRIIAIDGLYAQGAAKTDATIMQIFDIVSGLTKVVTRTDMTYDIAGNLTSYVDTYTDENGNTVTDHTIITKFDENANPLNKIMVRAFAVTETRYMDKASVVHWHSPVYDGHNVVFYKEDGYTNIDGKIIDEKGWNLTFLDAQAVPSTAYTLERTILSYDGNNMPIHWIEKGTNAATGEYIKEWEGRYEDKKEFARVLGFTETLTDENGLVTVTKRDIVYSGEQGQMSSYTQTTIDPKGNTTTTTWTGKYNEKQLLESYEIKTLEELYNENRELKLKTSITTKWYGIYNGLGQLKSETYVETDDATKETQTRYIYNINYNRLGQQVSRIERFTKDNGDTSIRYISELGYDNNARNNYYRDLRVNELGQLIITQWQAAEFDKAGRVYAYFEESKYPQENDMIQQRRVSGITYTAYGQMMSFTDTATVTSKDDEGVETVLTKITTRAGAKTDDPAGGCLGDIIRYTDTTFTYGANAQAEAFENRITTTRSNTQYIGHLESFYEESVLDSAARDKLVKNTVSNIIYNPLDKRAVSFQQNSHYTVVDAAELSSEYDGIALDYEINTTREDMIYDLFGRLISYRDTVESPQKAELKETVSVSLYYNSFGHVIRYDMESQKEFGAVITTTRDSEYDGLSHVSAYEETTGMETENGSWRFETTGEDMHYDEQGRLFSYLETQTKANDEGYEQTIVTQISKMLYDSKGQSAESWMKTTSETGKETWLVIHNEFDSLARTSKVTTYNTDENFNKNARRNSQGQTRAQAGIYDGELEDAQEAQYLDKVIKYNIAYDNNDYGRVQSYKNYIVKESGAVNYSESELEYTGTSDNEATYVTERNFNHNKGLLSVNHADRRYDAAKTLKYESIACNGIDDYITNTDGSLRITTYDAYDIDGDLLQSTEQNKGNTIYYNYDEADEKQELKSLAAYNYEGKHVSTTEYDRRYEGVLLAYCVIDEITGRATIYEKYDLEHFNENLLLSKDLKGYFTEYAYDKNFDVTTTTINNGTIDISRNYHGKVINNKIATIDGDQIEMAAAEGVVLIAKVADLRVTDDSTISGFRENSRSVAYDKYDNLILSVDFKGYKTEYVYTDEGKGDLFTATTYNKQDTATSRTHYARVNEVEGLEGKSGALLAYKQEDLQVEGLLQGL
ncbi:MAG: hypothetical protein V2A72_00385, partial [Candidatus Omnitrophota bacterium]